MQLIIAILNLFLFFMIIKTIIRTYKLDNEVENIKKRLDNCKNCKYKKQCEKQNTGK